jgi:spore coat-associated protein N
MRSLVQLVLPIAVIVAVLTYGDTPAEPKQGAQLAMTSGGISLENSKNGSAVFNVGNLAPGDSGGGQVSLSNSGTLPGDLKLSQADVVDSPGPFGGQLSGVVQLTLSDLTNGNAVIYSGALSGLGQKALGSIAPGESRTYNFAITLPDGGAPPSPNGGDNAFRGSTMTARYQWDLTGDTPAPGGGGGFDDWDATGWVGNSSMRMNGRMSVKLALRKGIVNVYLRCSEACRLRARAALRRGSSLNSRRKSAYPKVPAQRVKISLKLSKRALKVLRKRVAKRGRDYIVVKVEVTDPRGGRLTTVKKKIITGKKKPANRR